MKNTENIVNLISGNISPENRRKVLSEINTNKEDKEVFEKTKMAWAYLSSAKKLQDYEIEKSYLTLKKKIFKQENSLYIKSRVFLKYAAILIVLISFSFLIYLNKQHLFFKTNEGLRYTSVVADNGQISKITLPDSSIVWLNSGTTLSYNSGYSKNNRDLILNGQAYLNVKKDNKNPLIVACNDFRVKVLGTKFDVCAYPCDNKIKVVLESGSVELRQAGSKAFYYKLKPGEMAQYNIDKNDVIIKETETANFTSWKEGYLIFKDASMADVFANLERKFNIKITVKDKEVYKSIFNANFKDEELKEILEYIQYSCPVQYKIVKKDNLNKSIIEFYSQLK